MLVYPAAAFFPSNRVPINIWHAIERQMLWVVLILGESVISIVLPGLPCQCDVGCELGQPPVPASAMGC